MRLNARTGHKFTLDLWSQFIVNDSNGSVSYAFTATVPATLLAGMQQTYIITNEPLPYSGMLRNVKDADGVSVFDHDVFVNSSEPLFDIYGRRTGYRQMVRRTAPGVNPIRPKEA